MTASSPSIDSLTASLGSELTFLIHAPIEPLRTKRELRGFSIKSVRRQPAHATKHSQETLVSQEHGLDSPLTPESHGVGQARDGRSVSSNETPSKVYPIKTIFFGIHVAAKNPEEPNMSSYSFRSKVVPDNLRNLPNIVADSVKQTLADIFLTERLLPIRRALFEDLAETRSDGTRFKTDLVVIGPVNITDEHVNSGIVSLFRKSEHF